MITHCILLSSSYYLGKRIALDYIIEDSTIKAKEALQKIMSECGKGIPISTHMIQAEKKTWESVIEADAYFKDVELIENIDFFIKLIKKDRTLLGIDIAKYILTQISCTHLKLEKLTYLCFAEYLCETNKRLFEDKIYAFKYGPIVNSVYSVCKKKYGYVELEQEKLEIYGDNLLDMPIRSRILCAEDGAIKLRSINKTLEKYGKFSASQLVDITHKEKSPWSKTGVGNWLAKREIKDDIIKEYHQYECV